MDLDALAAVRHPCDVCWSNTAPRPCNEASAETLVEAIKLYMAKTQGIAISALTLAKASSWSGPHDQMCLVLWGSVRGLESEAMYMWGVFAQLINEECLFGWTCPRWQLSSGDLQRCHSR